MFARIWAEEFDKVSAASPPNPKSELQEWAAARRLAPPRYEVAERTGPAHAPTFTVELTLAGLEPVQGRGRSRQEAEKSAAEAMLAREVSSPYGRGRGAVFRHLRRREGEGLMPTDLEAPTRAGFVAVIGAPNAGKSTLVNRLVGSKVSIVTRKVQTTRFNVRGVAIEGKSQIILVDTPGIFKPRRRLDRSMVRAAWSGAEDADVVVHLVDVGAEETVRAGTARAADKLAVQDRYSITEGLVAAGRKAILVLNKIDLVRHDSLLLWSQNLFQTGAYGEVFMVSAETGSGVEDLARRLAELMPEGPWLYPEDQVADLPTRLLAAEITREKIYLRLHEELPYAAAVETTAFTEVKDGSARIEQTIYVERESQRPIVLGKGGQTLKWIGQKAREELAELLGRPVHLFLHVKVDPRWAERRELYAGMGLEFDA